MRRTLVLALVFLGTARSDASLLFFDSGPDDYIGEGLTQLATDPDATFTASRTNDDGVRLTVGSEESPSSWRLEFAAAGGVPLAAGTYEGATRWPFNEATAPGLSVHGHGRGCNKSTGRFVVHEVAYDDEGEVVSFAADFVQYCDFAAHPLVGSIRYRIGEAACAGRPDGTAGDDHDACTQGEICQAGACIPGCGGGRAGCEADGICDPASGACTTGDTEATSVCDDGDLCTDDTCEVSGCAHTAVPCYDIAGKTKLMGWNGIRTVPRVQPFEGRLVLRDDGTYRVAGIGITSCASEIPDDVGSAGPGAGRQLVLLPSNLEAMTEAATECVGYPVSVEGYRTTLRLGKTGDPVAGISALAGSVDIFGEAVRVRGVARWKARPRGGATLRR